MQIIATCPPEDEDTLFRAFLAAGTAAHGNSGATSMGEDLGICQQAKERTRQPIATQQLKLMIDDTQKVFA
jgi:hypothetical protein